LHANEGEAGAGVEVVVAVAVFCVRLHAAAAIPVLQNIINVIKPRIIPRFLFIKMLFNLEPDIILIITLGL
jgi:hypothetical protein